MKVSRWYVYAATAAKMGQKATGLPNAFLHDKYVGPALKALKDEVGVIELALGLEKAAAESYTFAGGLFSVAPLRQAIMTIGGVEARHMAVLLHVQGQNPVPVPFMRTDDAVPTESFIMPTGVVAAYPAATRGTARTSGSSATSGTTGATTIGSSPR